MSNANYVPNSSNTSQQHDALGPDGSKVTNDPDLGGEAPQGARRWKLGTSLELDAFKYLPVRPDLAAVPSASDTQAPFFLLPPLTSSNNPMADVVLGEGRFPRIPEPSDAFLRSLLTTQIWQDNVLRHNSRN